MRYFTHPIYSGHPLAEKITATRYSRAIPETLLHVTGTIVTAMLVCYVLGENASFAAKLCWWVAMGLTSALFLCVYFIYKKSPQILDHDILKKLCITVAALFGLIWGASPWVFLNSTDIISAFILSTALFTMSIIAGSTLSLLSFRGYCCFFTPILLGSFLRLYQLDLPLPPAAFLFIPLLWVSIYIFNYDIYKMLLSSIQLRLENEQAFQEAAQANEEKSRFIATASHDIRQPLQAITYIVERLYQQVPKEMISTIKSLDESTSSMTTLLDGLLDISKLDAGVIQYTPEYFDIQPLIERICKENSDTAEKKELSLKCDIPSAVIQSDELILARILSNLISNAIKYTHQGEVEVYADMLGEHLIQINIKDTGVGIPLEQAEHIYKEFYQIDNPEQNQEKGLGLGLSIVQRLAKVIDLAITLESEAEQGTLFSFQLATHPEQKIAAPAIEAETTNTKILENLSILLVDDNQAVRESLLERLESWGCNVDSASSLDTAISTAKATTASYDLVITDYRLPEDKTGSDVIAAINCIFDTTLPCIIITADTAKERIQEADQNSTLLLHKPIKPAMLKVAVSRIVDWQ